MFQVGISGFVVSLQLKEKNKSSRTRVEVCKVSTLSHAQHATEIQAPAITKERLASAHSLSSVFGCECGFRSCYFSGGLKPGSSKAGRWSSDIDQQAAAQSAWHNPA